MFPSPWGPGEREGRKKEGQGWVQQILVQEATEESLHEPPRRSKGHGSLASRPQWGCHAGLAGGGGWCVWEGVYAGGHMDSLLDKQDLLAGASKPIIRDDALQALSLIPL